MDYGTNSNKPHHRSGHWVSGLILIGIGSLLLLERLALVGSGTWIQYWPFIIAIVGVGRIIDARSAAHVARGGFLIFVAFWLYTCMTHTWGLNFQNSWPVVLIALGLRHIASGLTSKSDNPAQRTPS